MLSEESPEMLALSRHEVCKPCHGDYEQKAKVASVIVCRDVPSDDVAKLAEACIEPGDEVLKSSFEIFNFLWTSFYENWKEKGYNDGVDFPRFEEGGVTLYPYGKVFAIVFPSKPSQSRFAEMKH